MKRVTCLLIVAILSLALGVPVSAEEPAVVVPVGQGGVQRVTIVGGSYFYRPQHIIVKVNIPVELTVSKESGLVPHDMVAASPEAGIEFRESLSTTPKTIRFTPTKTGTYPLYCSKKAPFSKSHREKGMEGVVEVVP